MEALAGHRPKTLEGLRFLPWLQDAITRSPDLAIADCQKCMTNLSTSERQALGCGYEPPVPHAQPWSPPRGKRPTACAGYLCTLPTVIEASRLRAHAKNGALAAACHEGAPTGLTLDAILVLDAELAALDAWRFDEADRKRKAGAC